MTNAILVFKTNINTLEQIKNTDLVLSARPEIKKWNIDMDDCDKVLRIESSSLEMESIINKLKMNNIYCEELA